MCNNPVDDVRNAEIASKAFNIFDSVLPKHPFQNTRNQVNHYHVAHLPQHPCQTPENLHSLRIHHQSRRPCDWRTDVLNMKSEFGRELEDGVILDMFRDVVVSFSLITDVNKPVVYTHLQFRGGFVSASLVVIEFL